MLPSRQGADPEQGSGPQNHLLGDGSAACEGTPGARGVGWGSAAPLARAAGRAQSSGKAQ